MDAARRTTLASIAAVLWLAASCPAAPAGYTLTQMDPNRFNSWLKSWSTSIISDSGNRYCDTATGESTGWLMAPFLNGYYYGYQATKDPNWVVKLMDWSYSWIKRGMKEPDGYIGWPSYSAAGTAVDNLNSYYADSMLGDAMVLRPIVEMAGVILSTPSLDAKYDANARAFLALANQTYAKWASRGGWRDTAGGGAISVVQPWGIVDPNRPAQAWTSGYALRNDPNKGFSHPDNKGNEVAMWLLAMYDATKDANYRDEAAQWYTLMKSRMTPKSDGTYAVWNYWQPAGAWDYDPNTHATKHWVGIHPNNGYYRIDVESIVDAYEHGVVFTLADIQRLVATDLALLAVDGNKIWPALAPYSPAIQARFESNYLNPSSWGGHTDAAWYLSLQTQVPEPASLTALALGAAAVLRLRRRRRHGHA